MGNTTIPALTDGGEALGTDSIPVARGGNDVRVRPPLPFGPYANLAALQTAYPASAALAGRHAYVGSAAPYSVYTCNGAAWSIGSIGPFASTAALQTAYPAATNTGRLASVGAAAPYAIYSSNGSAWVLAVDAAGNPAVAVATRKVIIETDWWTDVDDVLAIRLALWGEKIGAWDILTMGINTTLANGPGSLDALCYADGRRKMPIGVPATSYVPSGSPAYQLNMTTTGHAAGLPGNRPTAVSLHRRALAAAANGSVEILSIGYLNNLADLLASPADAISSLTGAQLVAAKVSKLWVMGGNWPTGSENNFSRDATAIAAAAAVVSGWPTPIIFQGYEVGASVITGGNLVSDVATTDIVAKALVDFPTPGGRNSWDPMMAMACMADTLANAGYTSVQGTAAVNAGTGANSFTVGAGTHSYLVKSQPDSFYTKQINNMVVPAYQTSYYPGVSSNKRFITTYPRTDIGLAQPVIPAQFTAGVDDANLYCWLHAADLASAGLADGAVIDAWQDRKGNRTMTVAGTNALRPTFAASKVGRPAVAFSGSQRLVNNTVGEIFPAEHTIYARVEFDTAPAGNQSVIAQENTGATVRSFYLRVASGIAAQGVSFFNGTGSTANANAVAITTGAWQIVGQARGVFKLAAFYNATRSADTVLSNVDTVLSQLTIGGRQGGTEFMTGWVAEIRVYEGYHDATKAALVIADMT